MSAIIHLLVTSDAGTDLLDRTLRSIIGQAGSFRIALHVQNDVATIRTDTQLADWANRLKLGTAEIACEGVALSYDVRPFPTLGARIARGLTERGAGDNEFLGWMEAGDCLRSGALAHVAEAAEQFSAQQLSWIVNGPKGSSTDCLPARVFPRAVMEAGLADGITWPELPAAGCFFRGWLWNGAVDPEVLGTVDRAAAWQIWRQMARRASPCLAAFSLAEQADKKLTADALAQEINAQLTVETRRSTLTTLPVSALDYRILARRTDKDNVLRILRHDGSDRRRDPFAAPKARTKRSAKTIHIGAFLDAPTLAEIDARIDIREGVAAYDAHWQFPAITEQHAFHQMHRFGPVPRGTTYVAFPWATLIDTIRTNGDGASILRMALRRLAAQLPQDGPKATVCQHIKMREHIDLFRGCGITHIFWSHATEAEAGIGHPRILPFPLYPVQQVDPPDATEKRSHLFSFVGAKPNQYYLKGSRRWILETLADAPEGLVIGRNGWHYNRIVYDHQIRKISEGEAALIDDKASEEFKISLTRSVFSLCPSGTGPNSIRLWESLGAGAIPVILADGLALPGDPALWEAGTVRVPETEAAVRALPETLAAIAAEPSRLEAMRRAMAQLWLLYGPSIFVTDVLALLRDRADALFLSPEEATSLTLTDEDEASVTVEDGRSAVTLLRRRAGELLMALTATPPDETVLGAMPGATVAAARRILPGTHPVRAHHDQVAALVRRRIAAPALGRGGTIRVHLLDGHGHRTPLAYPAFRRALGKRVDLVAAPERADVVMTGFDIDLKKSLGSLAAKAAKQAHVVLSEEPLWDLAWSGDFTQRDRRIEKDGVVLPYSFLNHHNSAIFDFEALPYFVLTQNHFALRYSIWLQRFEAVEPTEMLSRWEAAPIRAAFVAEVRETDPYRRDMPEADVYGLGVYRTEIARAVEGPDVLRIGRGWHDGAGLRQQLPDWHLDKLQMVTNRCRILSAYENTHQTRYISEKLFDAFAAGAIPTFYASPSHRVQELVPEAAMINTFDQDAATAARTIAAFRPDRDFAAEWLAAARRLRALFADPALIARERKRVAEAVWEELTQLV